MTNKRIDSTPASNNDANQGPAVTGKSDRKSESEPRETHHPEQFEIAEKARQDVESDRVDTDRYNTSGNDAKAPKTPDSDS